MPTQIEKGEAFRALHAGDAFVIPNPWDAGSAKVLEGLGFAALATTSSGFAYTLGRTDGGATLDELLAHVAAIAEATAIPLSVDLEHGHGPAPAELPAHVAAIADATAIPLSVDLEHGHGPAPADAARAIERVAAAGAVGGSIEDYDPAGRLYERAEAVERVAAAAAAARGLDVPFTLTARAENHIRGNPDLDDTIGRLQAYAEAGADVLYAPGLRTSEEIAAVTGAVDRPLNVLALPGMSITAIAGAGARRISVGGGLAWAAVNGLVAAARELQDGAAPAALGPPRELRGWLGA